MNLAKEQISIANNLDPDAPGTMFIRRNIYEADGKFEEAYKCVDEKLIKENDRNDKLRKRYKEKINKMRLCRMLAMTLDITAIILILGAYSIISMNDTIILGVITLIVGTILSNVVSKNK